MYSSSQLRLVVPGESIARSRQAAARPERRRRRLRPELRARIAAGLIRLAQRLAPEQSMVPGRSA
jgi:hypothetical protein